MKLFIWDRVNHATANYHDQGGIVVIAETLDRARELVTSTTKGSGDHLCEAATAEPDMVRDCEGPEYITIHPDAGCC